MMLSRQVKGINEYHQCGTSWNKNAHLGEFIIFISTLDIKEL